jgi:thiol-disulfide isomerase/thioredoxin
MTLFAGLLTGSSDVQFFNGGISYWSKPKIKKSDAALPKRDAPSKFDWNKHLDPENPEFFKEGNHVPPEPFMELVRRPTDQNIKLWFSYVEKKNALATRLAERMKDYAAKNLMSSDTKTKLVGSAQSIPLADDEFERYRFRMYFDSTCPHCQKMIDTLNDLQDRGYFVEAKQVDSGPVHGAHFAIQSATKEELKKFQVNAVPLLLIGDLKAKRVYRLPGFAAPNDVLNLLKQQH